MDVSDDHQRQVGLKSLLYEYRSVQYEYVKYRSVLYEYVCMCWCAEGGRVCCVSAGSDTVLPVCLSKGVESWA